MTSSNSSRTGFTLIELLVVVAIVGVLVGLLLPAVQQARSAARRITCFNSLKQIGLAFHNYESAHRRLPAGYIYKPGPQGNHAGFGWGSLLLPYMEQSAHQGQLNFKVPLFDPVNRPPREIHINIFMCPEDTESPNGFVEMGSEKYAMASYVASFGPPDLTIHKRSETGFSHATADTICRSYRRTVQHISMW